MSGVAADAIHMIWKELIGSTNSKTINNIDFVSIHAITENWSNYLARKGYL